jgi:hypothetical protein
MNKVFESKIKVSPDVLFQEINGETVLLDLKSESYFGLDVTGTRIWQLLQENDDLPAVHKIMSTEFEVEPAQLQKDLIEHMMELESAGLVTISDKKTD